MKKPALTDTEAYRTVESSRLQRRRFNNVFYKFLNIDPYAAVIYSNDAEFGEIGNLETGWLDRKTKEIGNILLPNSYLKRVPKK